MDRKPDAPEDAGQGVGTWVRVLTMAAALIAKRCLTGCGGC